MSTALCTPSELQLIVQTNVLTCVSCLPLSDY